MFGTAVAVGVAAKLIYELWRYRAWGGIEDELEEWKGIDRLGRNPSYEG